MVYSANRPITLISHIDIVVHVHAAPCAVSYLSPPFLFYFNLSVASLSTLGLSQLVHLGHSLLELDVLALLVAMSLVGALPWCVPGLAAALVERDEEVGAAVTVCQR
jgi:hypothetical protein